MLLATNPDETGRNLALLKGLITKWCRPIFQIATDYSKLDEVERGRADQMLQRKREFKATEAAAAAGDSTRAARLPSRAHFDYAVRPEPEQPAYLPRQGGKAADREDEAKEVKAPGARGAATPGTLFKRLQAKMQKSKTVAQAFTVKIGRL